MTLGGKPLPSVAKNNVTTVSPFIAPRAVAA